MTTSLSSLPRSITRDTPFRMLDDLLHRKADPDLTSVDSRKVGNNTYAQRRGADAIAIRLHNTDVVTHHRNGEIVLDTGGWMTVTTKQRMNDWTPPLVRIYSVKGRWMITHTAGQKSGDHFLPNWNGAVAYADGMMLQPLISNDRGPNQSYYVHGATTATRAAQEDAHNKQIEKLIDRHLRGMNAEKHAQILSLPHAVPPCAMCLPVKDFRGQYAEPFMIIGEQLGDTQHLIDHLLDQALPYSLWAHTSRLRNASGERVRHLDLAKADLRRYLRSALLVGPISTRGGKRDVHVA